MRKLLALFVVAGLVIAWSPVREFARLAETATLDWLNAGALPSVSHAVLMSKTNAGTHASVSFYPPTGAAVDSVVNGQVPSSRNGADGGPLANQVLESYPDAGAGWTYGSGGATEAPIVVSSFLNSWGNAGAGGPVAQYWQDPFGVVHLEGQISGGTMTAAAFAIDANHTDSVPHKCAVVSNGAFGYVQISANGAVIPQVGSNADFWLTGCSWLK